MDRNETGPFRPQAGEPPPYLAGRDGERRVLSSLLGDLRSGCGPRDVFLCGPPGYGKTALLEWTAAEAEALRRVEVQWLDLSRAPDVPALAGLLAPRSPWCRFVSALAAASDTPRSSPLSLSDILIRRLRRKALVLLLDDAHLLVPQVGRALLNACQIVEFERLPLLLVFAGTPDLGDRLLKPERSLWGRREIYDIGPLDDRASAEAIRRPFEDDGISISDDARSRIVAESDGFPFFLQSWGRSVWIEADAARRAGDRGTAVTVETVERAAPAFERLKCDYLRARCREMERRQFVPAARAVAAAYAETPRLPTAQLDAAIAAAFGDIYDRKKAWEAIDEFSRSGLVWRHRGDTRWEPGIPSLMDYMREETAESAATAR